MIKIYSFLFVLLVISKYSFANNLNNECKVFIKNIEASEQKNTREIKNLFKTGVLWEVVTPDNKKNYLFGTIHSQDYLVSKYPPEVGLALINSKKLLLEVIPDNVANIMYENRMYYKNNMQLNDILDKVFFVELKEQLKSYNLTATQFNNIKYLKPWAAFNIIGRPRPVRAPSLESNLFRLAQEKMLKIESLETMDEIISSLEKLSQDDQIYILKDTICNHKTIIRGTKELVELYFKRDIAGIQDFNNQRHINNDTYERFIQIMLYDRNKKILEKIKNEFTKGDIFVALGISHLIAENGLLEILINQGYTLKVLY